MIYGYLAYLHIRGRGGAIRSATQGHRQRVLMLASPFPLPPLPNHHQKQICGIALVDPARLNKRAIRMRTPLGWISPSDVRLQGVRNDVQMKTDPPSSLAALLEAIITEEEEFQCGFCAQPIYSDPSCAFNVAAKWRE